MRLVVVVVVHAVLCDPDGTTVRDDGGVDHVVDKILHVVRGGVPVDVYDVDCQIPLREGGVGEEIAEPCEAGPGVCDGGCDEAGLACEGLDGFVVCCEGAWDGHAGGAVDAEVRFVEAEEGVGAVVGDGVGGGGGPVGREGGVVVED